MPKIVRVDVLDDDTLDIELSNGNLILLKLRPAAALTQIAGQKPATDGASVYWQDGTRLTLTQILNLVRSAD